MGSFRDLEIWWCTFISCSISSFKDSPTSSLSCSATHRARSNHLTCLPICLIVSRLLVLPYRRFTRQWANSPYVLMLAHCSDNLSEMLRVSYQLSGEAISASEHPYGTHVVPKKVKFWGLKVQQLKFTTWRHWRRPRIVCAVLDVLILTLTGSNLTGKLHGFECRTCRITKLSYELTKLFCEQV